MAPIRIEPYEDIAVVRLDNGVINAINVSLVERLSETISSLANRFKALVLAGGDKFFSIGFDIPELLDMNRPSMEAFFFKFNALVLDLLCIPMPSACAIKGHAIAGGAILALACDYRMAASGKTLIGLNEIKLGVPTPYLADMILRQITQDHMASELIYLGEFLDSAQAQKIGVISEMYPREEVESAAMEKMSQIMKFDSRAFAQSKANRVETIKSRYSQGHKIKNEIFLDCWFNPQVQEALKEAADKSFKNR